MNGWVYFAEALLLTGIIFIVSKTIKEMLHDWRKDDRNAHPIDLLPDAETFHSKKCKCETCESIREDALQDHLKEEEED